MKSIIAIIVLIIATIAIALPRVKRAPYELVGDAELITGPYQTSFSCDGLKYGYYADMANDCKIFHICYPRTLADGTATMEHYSFICGNQTVFDQYSQTCAHPEEAIPCPQARDFFYLNERYGVVEEQFHREEDVNQYNSVIAQFGSRNKNKK